MLLRAALGDDRPAHRADVAEVHNNRGVACGAWQLRTHLGRHDEAEPCFAEAVAACDRALQSLRTTQKSTTTEAWRWTVCAKSCRGWDGTVRRSRCAAAVAAYDRALQIAPDYAAAHNNRAAALRASEISSRSCRVSTRRSRAMLVPSRPTTAHANRARLRRRPQQPSRRAGELGNLRSVLSRHRRGGVELRRCRRRLRPRTMHRAGRRQFHTNRGNVLQSLGDLQAGLGRHGDAETSYVDAIAAYDHALHVASGNPALDNLGMACGLGDLQAALSRFDQAEESAAAVAAYERALQIASNDTEIHNNQDLALRVWAISSRTKGGMMRRRRVMPPPSRPTTGPCRSPRRRTSSQQPRYRAGATG